MKWRIRRCPVCGRYTLKIKCPQCGSNTVVAHPHRFSPEDKYVRYRVMIKYPHIIMRSESRSDYPAKANKSS